jgi:hypothetical protein
MKARLVSLVPAEREDGVALVMAIIIIAIISIAAASAIFYTDGSQRDAFSKRSGATAYSLAQAGMSNAQAQLTSEYYDSSGQPHDNTTSLTTMASSWAPSGADPGGCTVNDQSACTTWSGTLYCRTPASGCPADPNGFSFKGAQRAAWYVTATGSVPNPSGTQAIQKTIHVYVPVDQPPGIAAPPDILKAVYSGKTGPGCDLTVDQGTIWAAPVYALGNFCIGQNAGVEAGTQNLGRLTVGGWINPYGNGAHVGKSTTPLSNLYVAGSCDGSQTMTPCSLTKPNGKNYYTDAGGTTFVSAYDTSSADVQAQFPSPPSVDWTARAQDGSDFTCTGGASLSDANFNLAGSPYTCTSNDMQNNPYTLSWDGTTLTINGNVYVQGNLITNNNASIDYKGLGSIFVGGSVTFGNNTGICAGTAPSSHDCPNGAGPTGGQSWDSAGNIPIASNFLMIEAKGTVGTNSTNGQFAMEGGLYSDQNISFGSGHTAIYGPLVTPQQIIPGQQAASGFPNILDLFTGGPDSPTPYWTLGSPTQGSY